MNTRPSSERLDERGAALVHMAIAMVAIMAFSALVIDYGIFWVSRRQAQNSADAGALAGAMALTFDDPTDLSATGLGKRNAKAAAEVNLVWGLSPNVDPNADIEIRTPSTAAVCPDDAAHVQTCVKVDVYRDTAHSNSLPTYFGKLVNVNTQDVRASATATVQSGTQSDCIRPWAVADKWEEHIRCTSFSGSGACNGSWVPNSTWDLTQTFDKYTKSGARDPAVDPPDVYRAPGTIDAFDPGTGFRLKNTDGTYADYGQFVQLKLAGGEDVVSPGWFLSLDMSEVWSSDPDALPAPSPRGLCTSADCPNGGATLYKYAIENCVGGTAGVGDWLRVETGAMTGPTASGTYTAAYSLYNKDPSAIWDPATRQIMNSCAPGVCADGQYHATSTRIVPVALFDLDRYFSHGYTGSNGYVQITNVFGFFIINQSAGESLAASYGLDTTHNVNGKVYGVMVAAPGLKGTSTIPPTSTFLQTIVLVR